METIRLAFGSEVYGLIVNFVVYLSVHLKPTVFQQYILRGFIFYSIHFLYVGWDDNLYKAIFTRSPLPQ